MIIHKSQEFFLPDKAGPAEGFPSLGWLAARRLTHPKPYASF
jgi:hypothetical protein